MALSLAFLAAFVSSPARLSRSACVCFNFSAANCCASMRAETASRDAIKVASAVNLPVKIA